MKKNDFIKKFGDEPQEVTKNFAAKSLAQNYDVKDAFIEFIDNAYDARLKGETLNTSIVIDDVLHTIDINDDGTGINDDTNLFKLGATTKEKSKDKIGKYGIGAVGALAAIATKCVYDSEEPVIATYTSNCSGKWFTKSVAFYPDGELIIGQSICDCRDENEHYTNLKLTNVSVVNKSEVVDALEETFENTLRNDLNISFNKRQLGKTFRPTFVGDETPLEVQVGDITVEVLYRIIGGTTSSTGKKRGKDRNFEESGLRIYDKESGRLLAKKNDYWRWFGNISAQPNICGLRAGIFIPSTIEAYNKFGIVPAKNGVAYRKYCVLPEFKVLQEKLRDIYRQASTSCRYNNEEHVTVGGKVFQFTTAKMDSIYSDTDTKGVYIVKSKPTKQELANLISEYINLKNRVNKRNGNKFKKAV